MLLTVPLPSALVFPSFAWRAVCLYYFPPNCRSGEIGIRTRLKIWRGHTHVGSSPTSGTNPLRIPKKSSPLSS